MTNPIIISFFTDDWEYPKHAERLKKECESHGLEYHIEQRESTKDYIKNTSIKPFFIRDCIDKFQRPVFWVDVDALIMKKIDIEIKDQDIAACRYFNEKIKRSWSVASLFFNYTEKSKIFLDHWCDNSKNVTDEASFEITWQSLKEKVKILQLPESYNFVKWSYRLSIPEDTIICHQLSKFEDKMRRKVNGQVKE